MGSGVPWRYSVQLARASSLGTRNAWHLLLRYHAPSSSSPTAEACMTYELNGVEGIFVIYTLLELATIFEKLRLHQTRQSRDIKQFHLVFTFIIWCLFSLWCKYSENTVKVATVVILVHNSDFIPKISNIWQSGYQTVPFGVYIQNLMCVFILE